MLTIHMAIKGQRSPTAFSVRPICIEKDVMSSLLFSLNYTRALAMLATLHIHTGHSNTGVITLKTYFGGALQNCDVCFEITKYHVTHPMEPDEIALQCEVFLLFFPFVCVC